MIDLWKMLHTKRWHTRPQMHHVHDDTGGHSGRMAAMAFNCWDDVSMDLIRACLEHDAAEAIMGDLPHDAKKDNKKLKQEYEKAEHKVFQRVELNDVDIKRLKFLDLLDACRMVKLYSPVWFLTEGIWKVAWNGLHAQALDLDVKDEFIFEVFK